MESDTVSVGRKLLALMVSLGQVVERAQRADVSVVQEARDRHWAEVRSLAAALHEQTGELLRVMG